MNFTRVIPRDFFNEAKLLNCLGKLEIAIECEPRLVSEHDGKPFQIYLNDSNELYVDNYTVYVFATPNSAVMGSHGREMRLWIPYNSRSKYPLYGEYNGEEYELLDDVGNFIGKLWGNE